MNQESLPAYTRLGYELFLYSMGPELEEAERFDEWLGEVKADNAFGFEALRLGRQTTQIEIERQSGERFSLLNFSSYNYLGLSHHPEVIAAAKDALDRHGLGAASSPVHGGTFALHRDLERELVDFVGVPGNGASLFSSGYAVNVGTLAACMKRGHYIVADRSAHMSILEGAQLSRSKVLYFRHNDVAHLREVLASIEEEDARILICVEGVYSADGDTAPLRGIVDAAKERGALTLVDEAHSFLVAGANGRGVCEAEGVLAEVDFLVLTFSKAFGGVGGALIAKEHIVRYVNWYARCRMFSCAIDPAVSGGILEALRIARSEEGARRRQLAVDNASYLREKLRGKVDIGQSTSWIVPVIFGADVNALPLFDWLQRHGLEGSIMLFPAVPKNEARVRLFVTSEHTPEQLDRCAEILLEAADQFGFRLT
jgi:7-keto-8-aminopelargonate synthetase-like enzyme